MVLRLHELPPEYEVGPDTGCFSLADDEGPKPLREFAAKYRPRTCEFEYQRLFQLPGETPDPPEVESFAVGAADPGAADAGLAIAPELVTDFAGSPGMTATPSPVRIGDATALLHGHHAFVGLSENQPASAVVWRFGSTLAAVYVTGEPTAKADEATALQLAAIQQQHVANPTPYTTAERDDSTVPFENPAIRLPVYWLGTTFRPGHGLPASSLREAFLPFHGPAGMKGLISYEGIDLGTWTTAGWRHRERSSIGPLVREWRCTTATHSTLPHGYEVSYAGYAKNFARCPSRPPNVFLAEVHTAGLVIGIDVPACLACIEPGTGPYHSTAALKLVARGLRLHP
jgi:hypothetical protein